MTISKAMYLAAPALFVCGTFIVYKFRYEQFGGGLESLQSVAEKKDRNRRRKPFRWLGQGLIWFSVLMGVVASILAD